MFKNWITGIILALTWGSSVGANPVINEFMAVNESDFADEDGEYPDWIEIQNTGTTTINLEGYYLTDNENLLTKWVFPDTELCAGCFLVVFASEKNRNDPGEELHTNFKLDRDGEYLALVAPGGTNILQAFEPIFPAQFESVSFGLPSNLTNGILLSAGAPGKVHIPDSNANETNWFEWGFDDSAWSDVETGIGYERNASGTNWQVVASMGEGVAVNDFSGVQGQDGWYYGYLDVDVNGDDSNYEANPNGLDEMTLFPGGEDVAGGHSATDHWTGTFWDWFQGNPPWTQISSTSVHPNDSNPGGEHYSINRYVVEPEVIGEVRMEGYFRNNSANGDGTTGRIFYNGAELYAQVTDGNQVAFDVTQKVFPGDYLDFMVDTGPADQDGSDGTSYRFEISDRPDFADVIGSGGDLEAAMYSINPGAWLRLPFVLDSVAEIQALSLRILYDDGFVAYLNGLEVANRNANLGPSYDDSALAARTPVDALIPEVLSLNDFVDQLQIGTNVLAVHGMNIAADDDTFLVLPELDVLRQVSTNVTTQFEYFLEPTPGAENISGVANIGPVFLDVTDAAPLVTNIANGIFVQAEVQQTRFPIDRVRLYHRIMWDAEVMVDMADDGSNGDLISGDGIYSATIPLIGLDEGQMIRWRFEVEDNQQIVTRSPLFIDTSDSDEYYGTIRQDSSIESHLPVLHWFAEDPAGANSRTPGTRCSFYYLEEFYDNIQVDLHGQSTGSFPKKSYDIDFNRNNRFRWAVGEKRVKDVNLLTNWADKSKIRNTMAYETLARAGAPHHYAFPVRVQQNTSFFAVADMVEDGDDISLERNGLDPDGAFYKMYNRLDSTSGAEKKTRKEEGKEDLQTLIDGLTTGSASEQVTYVYDHIDLAQAANYYACQTVSGTSDWGHKNYYMYRDTNGTGEWFPITWDVDLSFGHVWVGGYFVDTLFVDNPVNIGSANNRLKQDFYGNAEFYQMFTRRLRTLLDKYLQPPETAASNLFYEARFDEIADMIDPPGIGISDADLDWNTWGSWTVEMEMREYIDRMRTDFFPGRRNFLYITNSVDNGGVIPHAQMHMPPIQVEGVDFNPVSGNQDEEYIRIVNTNDFAVDISDWMITGAVEHVFIGGTVLRAHDNSKPDVGSLYLARDSVAFRARAVSPSGGENRFVQTGYSGQLNARGETIYLLDDQTNLIHSYTYPGAPTELQEALRISEINYAPAAPTTEEMLALPGVDAEEFEFIELVNISETSIDISLARFVEGVQFLFPSNTLLAAGARILVVENQAAFELRYGSGRPVAGQYTGNLNNGGEKIRLQDAVGENILTFEYDNNWLAETDGGGRSLSIRDAEASYTSWSMSGSWRMSAVDAGSPGWNDTTLVDDDFDDLPDAWETDQFASTSGSFASDRDGDTLTDGEEYVLGFDPNSHDDPWTVQIAGSGTAATVFIQTQVADGVGYTQLERVYTLESAPQINGPYTPVTGYEDIVGTGQVISHSDANGGLRYYRGRVALRVSP